MQRIRAENKTIYDMRQIYKLCMCTRVHALTHHHHHHQKEIYETSSWLWVYEE